MTKKNGIRVLIADDQSVVRQGFELFLTLDPALCVVGHASNGVDAVETCTRHFPDVVLMDIRMPHRDGLWATREILRNNDSSKVIVVTTFAIDEYLFQALDAGASGFILKDCEPDELVTAVKTVAAGGVAISPGIVPRLVAEFVRRKPGSVRLPPSLSEWGLTARELDVVALLVRGEGNEAIARTLYLEPSTIKSHVASICRKLGVKNRVQVVIWAYESGVVQVKNNEHYC